MLTLTTLYTRDGQYNKRYKPKMNVLEIIGRDVQTLTTESVIQERLRKRKTLETKSIKTEQIQNGSGTLDPTSPYYVPDTEAELLNLPPNPDRNGITYMWAFNLFKKFGEDIKPISMFCNLLGLQGVKEGEIQSSGLGIYDSKPTSLAILTKEQYEKLRDFVRGCFVPTLNKFNEKQNSKNTNLEILGLNLWKSYHDVLEKLASS